MLGQPPPSQLDSPARVCQPPGVLQHGGAHELADRPAPFDAELKDLLEVIPAHLVVHLQENDLRRQHCIRSFTRKRGLRMQAIPEPSSCL